jgi:hypothetical protein
METHVERFPVLTTFHKIYRTPQASITGPDMYIQHLASSKRTLHFKGFDLEKVESESRQLIL